MTNDSDEHVLLLHGILMSSLELRFLGYQLNKAGYQTHYVFYHSVLKTVEQNAYDIQRKLSGLNCNKLHIVAHSLGGLVTLHLLKQNREFPPGRVVMLGSPVNGSWLAQQLCRWPLISRIIAKSLPGALDGKNIPDWPPGREWGMIAGTKNRGLGWLVGGLPEQSDGTVMLHETSHPAQKDHLSLPVSHTGMIFSRKVVSHCLQFLENGHF